MQKGGVGKTTTTVNLAAALAEMGRRVLAVDLDPQGNLTQHAGFDPDTITPTVYDVLKAEVDGGAGNVRAAIYQTAEGYHLLPSQPELSLVEVALINTLSRERILAGLLGEVAADYDYILIDCNPSLGLLVINALTAADSVLIPIQTEYLAARGALMILSTIETIRRKRLNPQLQIEGILLTMADTRASLTRDIQQAVEQQRQHRPGREPHHLERHRRCRPREHESGEPLRRDDPVEHGPGGEQEEGRTGDAEEWRECPENAPGGQQRVRVQPERPEQPSADPPRRRGLPSRCRYQGGQIDVRREQQRHDDDPAHHDSLLVETRRPVSFHSA